MAIYLSPGANGIHIYPNSGLILEGL